MLPVAGIGTSTEYVLYLAVLPAKVVEIAFFDEFVEAVDGIEVCQV